MGLFHTDSVALTYSNVEAAKQWWIDTFGCKVMRVPPDWDNPLPSDVALTLPGDSEPTILLSARSEVEEARFERPSSVATVIFCDKLKKAYEHFSGRGVLAGPIQDGGDMQFDHRQLRLRVRDDGKGIDPRVLESGARAGHYGLRTAWPPGTGQTGKR